MGYYVCPYCRKKLRSRYIIGLRVKRFGADGFAKANFERHRGACEKRARKNRKDRGTR